MSVDPFERVRLGRARVSVTRLGVGVASLAGLYREVPAHAAAVTLAHAWGLGIRYFDAAPLYGYGLAEERLGKMLRKHDASEYVISTKVGRRLVPLAEVEADPSLERDWQRLGAVTGIRPSGADADGAVDWYFHGVPDVRPVFDFSYDGVMRSVEDSLERTGLERLDVLWIHDPDDHWQQAIGGAYPALAKLRDQGIVSAIGVGMNQAPMLARFARECDLDAFMLAGRYTLLDQRGLPELLPLCLEKGIAVVIAGVFNSGLLANPRPEAHFDYGPAPAEWVEKALRLRTVCERHAVPLRAAALQFVLAHPAVVSIVAGVRSATHLDDTVENLRTPIPDALWDDLRQTGLLPPDAPTPRAAAMREG